MTYHFSYIKIVNLWPQLLKLLNFSYIFMSWTEVFIIFCFKYVYNTQ